MRLQKTAEHHRFFGEQKARRVEGRFEEAVGV
jgi:hypothetical protein